MSNARALALFSFAVGLFASSCRGGSNIRDRADVGGPDAGSDGGVSTDGGLGGELDLPVMPSLGCGQPQAPGESIEEIVVEGVRRTYVLTIPEGYEAGVPMPLVFGWHGSGTRGAAAILPIGVVDAARGAALFVHADALPDANGLLRWNLRPSSTDVMLFDALYAHVTSTLCVDEARVFSYGFSLGGYMSNLIGCLRAETHAAIAPFHGGGPAAGLACTGPVAALISNREQDALVPIEEGLRARDHWTSANGCSLERPVGVEPSPCVEYQGCAPGRPVIWCRETEGEHTPPPQHLPDSTWRFFQRFLLEP